MKLFGQSQFQRIFDTISMIRKGMQNDCLVNCTTFVDSFGVDRQTALRDINHLRIDFSAPIEYDSSRKGYYLADPEWCIPSLKLERKEVFALGIARKLMTVFRGTPLEDEMHSALAKISANLEGFISIDPVSLHDNVTVLGDDYVPQDPDIWLKVARFAQKNEQISMTYVKFNGEKKDYIIDPYHLAAYHGEWYLLGYHHRRKCVATFAVSRIKKIKGVGACFLPPSKTVIEEKLTQGFGISYGGEIYDVHLRCAPCIASYISNRIWHTTQKIKDLEDGSVDLFMKTSGWKELVRFVLSWQPDIDVISPVELRERIKCKMIEALDRK